MRYYMLLGAIATLSSPLLGLSGTENTGQKPHFSGSLTSQQGHTFTFTNISIGRDRSRPVNPKLYEMPTKPVPKGKNYSLDLNPYKDLTTASLDLIKVSSITIPEPNMRWTWQRSRDGRAAVVYEFIEVILTWKSEQTLHYLLELGPESANKPLKLFLTTIDNTKKGTAIKQSSEFCIAIAEKDTRDKGAPWQAVKKITIDGHCFPAPQKANNGKVAAAA